MKRIQISLILSCLLALQLPTLACTTFLISGKHTADGKSILFKNRDTDQLQNALAVFTDGKYKYIGLVDGTAHWEKMVWGGYNETGFAIINSAAYNNNIGDTTRLIDKEGLLMKRALQQCKTLKDFENLLDTLAKPMGVDANFGVIDAEGGAAFYETGNFRYKKFNADEAPDGLLIRTNHSMSADLTKGFGFCRYNTAVEALKQTLKKGKLQPQVLFNALSRNLTHSLTGTNLWNEMPPKRDVPAYKFFIDYIPRNITASAIMVVGAKDQAHAQQTMMWSILGFPLTSVAVPVWISAGNKLPRVVTMDSHFKAPLCVAALKLKEDCFPLTYDRGSNYINLSAVINKQKTGYLQLLQPVENEIFRKAGELMYNTGNESVSATEIQRLYDWLDEYLSVEFKSKFNLSLLKK